MESTEHLARVIKEAKAQFERECANLPRPEINRLWQRQLSELISSTTGAAGYHLRVHRSEPGNTDTSKLWKTRAPTLAASKVAAEALSVPLLLHRVSAPFEEGPALSPQNAPTYSHASQQIPEEGVVQGAGKRKRKRSFDTVSTYDLLPPPYALSDV